MLSPRCKKISYLGLAAKRQFAVDATEIEVSPVARNVVASLGKIRLLDGSCLEILHPMLCDKAALGGLVVPVECHLRGRGDKEPRLMSLSVVRPDLIGNIVNGCGNHIKVVDKHRSRKHKIKIQTSAAEGVISAR